jgi:hypothetical protein
MTISCSCSGRIPWSLLEEALLLITENMAGHVDKEQSNAQLERLWQVARQETKGVVGEAGLHPSLIPREPDAE